KATMYDGLDTSDCCGWLNGASHEVLRTGQNQPKKDNPNDTTVGGGGNTAFFGAAHPGGVNCVVGDGCVRIGRSDVYPAARVRPSPARPPSGTTGGCPAPRPCTGGPARFSHTPPGPPGRRCPCAASAAVRSPSSPWPCRSPPGAPRSPTSPARSSRTASRTSR